MAIRTTQQYVETLAVGDGDLRITQQTVEILSSGNGALRVTQQYVEILSSIATATISADAENTISLSDTAKQSLFKVSASSSIDLSHVADKETSILTVTAKTVIPEMTVTAENNVFDLNAENTIALSDDIGVAGPLSASASSTINATVTADGNISAFGRFAESVLDISGSNPAGGLANTNIRNLYVQTPDPETDTDYILGQGITDIWSSIARLADTYELTAENTIELVSIAPQPTGSLRYSAESTLNLLDFVDNNVKSREVEDTISLSQEATYFKVYGAVSQLTLTSTADQGFVNLFAESVIELDHIGRPNPLERSAVTDIDIDGTWGNAAESSIKNLSLETVIPIDHDIGVLRPYRVEAETVLSGVTDDVFIPPIGPVIPGEPFGLMDEASVQVNPIRNPETPINLSQSAVVVHIKMGAVDLTAESAVGLVDQANLSIAEEAVTVIDSLQVTANVEKNTSDALSSLDDLIDEALFTINRAETPAESIIDLKHSVAYSLVRDTTECDYTPFVSESDADTTPPRPLLPEVRVPVLEGVRFRLAYPPFDTGDTVDYIDIRAPEFGNKERIEPVRVNRESVGGSLVVFADPIWPEVQTLQMTFASLTQTQGRGLLNFIERWLGQEIGIYDHEGRVWKGVIINPDEAVTEDGRCRFSAAIDIEAQRVHQLNRTARSNLGMSDVAGQDEALAASAIMATDAADYVLTPVAPGISALDLSDSSDYTKVPVGAASTGISLAAFATRNSFFYESASSSIDLSHSGRELDFDDFGNLIHNWDAENTSGVSSGNPVSSWADLGSSPVTLNATVSQEPTARDNILNGRRVIEFRHSTAVQRMISASNVPLWHLTNKTGTIFIVTIIRETLSSGNEVIIGNNTDKIFFGGSTSTQRPVALLSGEGTVALETPQSVLASGTTQLLMLKRDGNDLYFRRNKTDEDGTTFSTNPTAGDEQLYFGGFSGAGNSVDQDIAQVLIYDDILSDTDVLTIEGLLAAKWGV